MSVQQIFNLLVEFFEEDNWTFQWMEGTSVLSMGFAGKNGKWQCYAQAREPQQQFVFYSVVPVNAPPEKRPIVAEFITRANYGMIMGNFEMDYSDGEIRYKTSIDVEGDELSHPLIRQVVYANVIITDRYLPGLMSVIYGNASAEKVLLEIENPDEQAVSAEEEEDELDDDILPDWWDDDDSSDDLDDDELDDTDDDEDIPF